MEVGLRKEEIEIFICEFQKGTEDLIDYRAILEELIDEENL